MPNPVVQESKAPTYHAKTFHRKFEETYGYLKEEQFPPIDFSDKEQIEMLFPLYQRELIAKLKSGTRKLNKNVDIEGFGLRTPNNDRALFENTQLTIETNKRCALYGENGSGKTTLFEAIHQGRVRGFPKWMHVHHMKELEHNEEAEKVSVIDTVLCSHPFRRVLIIVEEILKKQIESEKDEARMTKLKANLEYVQFNMKKINGYTGRERAEAMLRVLGFDEGGFASLMSSLSGGLRMRVALASAFFIDSEVLLLDEPTNHLDMPSVLWLENKLRGYKGSYLLVTHDRTLLENVVTSVMLIQDLKLEYFDCGFKAFEQQKEKKDVDREKRIEKFLMRNRNLDPSTPLYRTKVMYQKWTEKRMERKIQLAGKFTFKSPSALKCEAGVEQKDVSLIKIDNVRFSYDVEKGLPFIFDTPVSYEVKVGTRVGIMGPNGAGKSTFLKLITGKIKPTEGKITTNPDFTLAYFGQHSTKELKMDMTPIEFMKASFPKDNEGKLSQHLEKTSISDGPANTRMENLSYSQRSCVIFAKLTYVPPHLLIMDEPTNFLDLGSVDALIKAANKFQGGLITVTHNRDFLKRCSKHFLSIVPGAFLEFKTMKQAERATYSFITAMEEGTAIDVKNAINNNRGGGAVHTEEYLAATAKRREYEAKQEQKKKSAAALEAERKAKILADREARAAAKLAKIKLDWVAGDVCYAPTGKGKWQLATVKRNIKAMGCTVELKSGKMMMIDAKKLRVENPAPEPVRKQGGRGGNGRGRNGRGGGRGGRGGRNGRQSGGRQSGGRQSGGRTSGGRGGRGRGGGSRRGGGNGIRRGGGTSSARR